jgi:LmbE family N-acetylglucosaminyl deacetylase
MKCEKVLVIAAHPDDEILGVGGTISRLVKKNSVVANAVILGEGATSRKNNRNETSQEVLASLKNNALKACEIIGYSNLELYDFPDNRFDSVDLLDIIKVVNQYIEKYRPDTIFTHHHGDLNVDHRLTFQSVITACRPMKDCCVQNILSFETPSATEWNFGDNSSLFKPNFFVDVAETLNLKLEAMKEYVTEINEFPHPRSNEALKTIAKRWGSVVGREYVEAFEVVRSVW